MRTKIKQILRDPAYLSKEVIIFGWLKSCRAQKSFSFLEINDGSSLSNLQVIAEKTLPEYKRITTLTPGSSMKVEGIVLQSPGKEQQIEVKAKKIHIFDACDPSDYPLQKKRHSFEFLRTIAHLRPRTNTQGAVQRVKNHLAFITHKFFQERNFFYIHTPTITSLDCEGGGELFTITTLDLEQVPKTEETVDFSKDFFSRRVYLTVSGQLYAEAVALALSDVYTFGPTFRADNSHTSRHLAEFWMIEPEMSFTELTGCINCAEDYIKYCIESTLANCEEDLKFFDRFIEKGLIKRLEDILRHRFEIISYTQAISILQKSNKKFEFPTTWGSELHAEHERYLTEEYCKKPVVIIDFPESIKAFYMHQNEDDETVAAMDILVPQIGEIIGGSQREERYDVLKKKMQKLDLLKPEYLWYLALRRYGSVPHSGFGVGFERLVQFITGMENIKEIAIFPRYPSHCDF